MVSDYVEKYYNDVHSTNKHEGKQTGNWSVPGRTARQCFIMLFRDSFFHSQRLLRASSLSRHIRMSLGPALHSPPKVSRNSFQTSLSTFIVYITPHPIYISKRLYVAITSPPPEDDFLLHYASNPKCPEEGRFEEALETIAFISPMPGRSTQ